MSGPTFWTRGGECQAIENRITRECGPDLLQALLTAPSAAPPGGRNIAIRRAVQRGTFLLAERYAAEGCNARRA
jgi:hypothetical protein